MNYEALEGLIKSILSSFKCQDCESPAKKKDLAISSIEGNSVTINTTCPNCGKTSAIKSEVLSLDLNSLDLSKEQIENIKKGIARNNSGKISKLKGGINDKNILDLNKNLGKDNLNVSELFLDN